MRLGEGCELYYRAFQSGANRQESIALSRLIEPVDDPSREERWSQIDETFNQTIYPQEANSWRQKLWRKCCALPLWLQAQSYLIYAHIHIILTPHPGETDFKPEVLSRRKREADLYLESRRAAFTLLSNDREGLLRRQKALFQLQMDQLYHDHRLPLVSRTEPLASYCFVHDEAAIRDSLDKLSWSQFKALHPSWQSRLGLGKVGEWSLCISFNPERLKSQSFTTVTYYFPGFGQLPAIQRRWLLKQSGCPKVAQAWPDLVNTLALAPPNSRFHLLIFEQWEDFLRNGGYPEQPLPYNLPWHQLLQSDKELLLHGGKATLFRTEKDIDRFFQQMAQPQRPYINSKSGLTQALNLNYPPLERQWLLKQSNCPRVAQAWPHLVELLKRSCADSPFCKLSLEQWENFLQNGGYPEQPLPYNLPWDELLHGDKELLVTPTKVRWIGAEEAQQFFRELTLQEMSSIDRRSPFAKAWRLESLLPLPTVHLFGRKEPAELFYDQIKHKLSLNLLMELPLATREWLKRQLEPYHILPWDALQLIKCQNPNNRFLSLSCHQYQQLSAFLSKRFECSQEQIEWFTVFSMEEKNLFVLRDQILLIDQTPLFSIGFSETQLKEIFNGLSLAAFQGIAANQPVLLALGITGSLHQKLSTGGERIRLSETGALTPFVFSWLLSKMKLDQLARGIAGEQEHRDWLKRLEGLPKESFWHQLSLHQWNQLLGQIPPKGESQTTVDLLETLLAREGELIATPSSAFFVSSEKWERWITTSPFEAVVSLKSVCHGLKNHPSRDWLSTLIALLPTDLTNHQQIEKAFFNLSLVTLSTLPVRAVDWLLDSLRIADSHKALGIQRDDFLHRIAIQSTNHLLWLPSLSEWHQALLQLLNDKNYEENGWQQLLPDDPSLLPGQGLLRSSSTLLPYEEFTDRQLTDTELEALMEDKQLIETRFPAIVAGNFLIEKWEANASWRKQLQAANGWIEQLSSYAKRHQNELSKLSSSLALIESLTELLSRRAPTMEQLWKEVSNRLKERGQPLASQAIQVVAPPLPNYRFPAIDQYPALGLKLTSSGIQPFVAPSPTQAERISSHWLQPIQGRSPAATLAGLLAHRQQPSHPLKDFQQPFHCYLFSDETEETWMQLEELCAQTDQATSPPYTIHWRPPCQDSCIELIRQLRDETTAAFIDQRGVGISNTGNSCYANALFQTLISLPSFWEVVEQRAAFESDFGGSLGPTVAAALLKARNDFDRTGSPFERGDVIYALRQELSTTESFKGWKGPKLTTASQQAADEVFVHLLGGLQVPGQQLGFTFESTTTANYPEDGVPLNQLSEQEAATHQFFIPYITPQVVTRPPTYDSRQDLLLFRHNCGRDKHIPTLTELLTYSWNAQETESCKDEKLDFTYPGTDIAWTAAHFTNTTRLVTALPKLLFIRVERAANAIRAGTVVPPGAHPDHLRVDPDELIDMGKLYGRNSQFYRMKAFMIHTGTANSGHYYCGARRNGLWLQFNDSQVKLFTPTELRAAAGIALGYFFEEVEAEQVEPIANPELPRKVRAEEKKAKMQAVASKMELIPD